MAKYYVICEKCGNEIRIELFGKIKDREWKLENRTWVCDECKEKELNEKNKQAALETKEKGLPELQGSEKQVAWANTLRINRINELKKYEYPTIFGCNEEKMKDFIDRKIALLAIFETEINAKYFIDNRYESLISLMRDIDLDVLTTKEEIIKQQKIEVEAKQEAIISPKNSKTATVAEIISKKNEINIIFPERNDDFIGIMKNSGYSWEERKWKKHISESTGDITDRIVEIGVKLNAAGFKIMVLDEETRKKIIQGNYEEEHKFWIITLKNKPRFLGIRFPYDSGYYDKARKIKCSRYSKPFVTVPVEQYEQVLDFAEQHGFRITKSAQKMIDDQKESEKNAFIADLQIEKKEDSKVLKEKSEIDQDLIDDEV